MCFSVNLCVHLHPMKNYLSAFISHTVSVVSWHSLWNWSGAELILCLLEAIIVVRLVCGTVLAYCVVISHDTWLPCCGKTSWALPGAASAAAAAAAPEEAAKTEDQWSVEARLHAVELASGFGSPPVCVIMTAVVPACSWEHTRAAYWFLFEYDQLSSLIHSAIRWD